ncbi:MAG: hypothetical protein HYZ49_14920 [Chloroflexi bacterium]|nr:hypothetical protein [Chloroflexota bacterium]
MATQTSFESETEQIYSRAIQRLQAEFGWTSRECHSALAQLAAGYGVLLSDVATVVLAAPSLKRGVNLVVSQSVLDHRPLPLRR